MRTCKISAVVGEQEQDSQHERVRERLIEVSKESITRAAKEAGRKFKVNKYNLKCMQLTKHLSNILIP